jgi:hypothetical protein
MNHLVFLDRQAGELEKILSGIKSMIVKEFDPAQPAAHPVRPGDSLYFLRGRDECGLRVRATVVQVRCLTDQLDGDLAQTLKEMQPRLQLTEDQYNDWSAKKQVLFVEFSSAHKIDEIPLAWNKTADGADWIAFKAFSLITE